MTSGNRAEGARRIANPLAALPPVILGPLWMVTAGLGYTLASACTRQLSSDYSTIQLAFLRCVVAVVFFVPMFMRNGIGVMKTTVFPLHLLRSFLTYGAMLTWFYAVSVIPVSDYTALLYAQPIFTILFAVIILGETAGARTWVAVAVAFVGALIILRPGFQVIHLGMVAALVTGVLFASVNTAVRFLSRTDASKVIVAYANILILFISFVPAMFVWKTPLVADLPAIAGIGVFALLGQYGITRAISIADARVVQPFDFSRLITAAIVGWIAFGETSDIYTWTGALVIFCASYYVIVFERRGAH